MHLETGKIELLDDNVDMAHLMDKYIAVADEMMTDKQQANMQVSKYDNKSYLGHLFTEHRKRKSRSAKEILKVQSKRTTSKKARKQNRK